MIQQKYKCISLFRVKEIDAGEARTVRRVLFSQGHIPFRRCTDAVAGRFLLLRPPADKFTTLRHRRQ